MASVMTTLGSNNAPMPGLGVLLRPLPRARRPGGQPKAGPAGTSSSSCTSTPGCPGGCGREHFAWRYRGSPWASGITDPDRLMPIMDSPDAIKVMVAGGPGKHSCVIPSFGIMPSSVTRAGGDLVTGVRAGDVSRLSRDR